MTFNNNFESKLEKANDELDKAAKMIEERDAEIRALKEEKMYEQRLWDEEIANIRSEYKALKQRYEHLEEECERYENSRPDDNEASGRRLEERVRQLDAEVKRRLVDQQVESDRRMAEMQKKQEDLEEQLIRTQTELDKNVAERLQKEENRLHRPEMPGPGDLPVNNKESKTKMTTSLSDTKGPQPREHQPFRATFHNLENSLSYYIDDVEVHVTGIHRRSPSSTKAFGKYWRGPTTESIDVEIQRVGTVETDKKGPHGETCTWKILRITDFSGRIDEEVSTHFHVTGRTPVQQPQSPSAPRASIPPLIPELRQQRNVQPLVPELSTAWPKIQRPAQPVMNPHVEEDKLRPWLESMMESKVDQMFEKLLKALSPAPPRNRADEEKEQDMVEQFSAFLKSRPNRS
jgi:hypothetical protein